MSNYFEYIIQGNLDELRKLESIGDIETIQLADDNYTLLHQAAHYGNLEVCKYILKLWKNFDIKDNRGQTALMEAANYENTAMVEHLLNAGADYNLRNNENLSALRYGCTRKNESIIIALLKAGANPNEKYTNGETPLMAALANGTTVNIIDLLVQAGAEINTKNEYGFSALIFSITRPNLKAAKHLLDLGARKDIELPEGQTIPELIEEIVMPDTREQFKTLFLQI